MPPKAQNKKVNGHVLAEKFNPGVVLKDLYKKEWTLGSPIGQGGFGLIYLAVRGLNANVTNQNADYVIKIEPKDNGPLFCELHFYTNCGKEADLKNFIRSYRLKYLGVPRYIASGIYEHNGKEFRFLAMDRYSKDLQTVLNENNNQLNENIVLYLTRQILYSLEYIHSKGYSHADIKGANLMLKSDKEVYLVDYGLAHRFSREGQHQNYTQKPEAKHNGTIEYTSRDAHDGVPPSRRGDIEILVYCIIHWLTGKLPWLNVLANKEVVHKQKINNMKSPKDFIATVFEKSTVSEKIKQFVQYLIEHVNTLKYDDEPCYLKIQNKISDTLKLCGYSNEDNFSMQVANTGLNKKKQIVNNSVATSASSKSIEIEEIDEIASDISEANILKTKRSRKIDLASESSKSSSINGRESPSIKKSKFNDESDSIKKPNKIIEELITNARSESPIMKKLKLIEENGFDDVTKSSKKNTNSSRDDVLIVDTDDKLRSKQLLNLPLRSSPRLNKSKVLSNETPKKSNGIHYIEDEPSNEDDDSIKMIKTPSKIKTRTPVKRLISTPSNNGSPLTRAKLTNQINEKLDSPLALNNIDKESKTILVKRRRNVQKSTISTQTESSYLSITKK